MSGCSLSSEAWRAAVSVAKPAGKVGTAEDCESIALSLTQQPLEAMLG